jgi:catechol 2,3-dioxygenase-like lactoylglutathione lyase family enzyme
MWKTAGEWLDIVELFLYNLIPMALKWDYVGVTASDLHRSVEFYRLVGIPLPDVEGDHVEVALDNGIRFALDSLELMKSIGHWENPVGHRMGLGINACSPAGVDEAFHAIVSAGFEGMTEPFDAFWGQRYAQVKDPDGNPVDLYAWID